MAKSTNAGIREGSRRMPVCSAEEDGAEDASEHRDEEDRHGGVGRQPVVRAGCKVRGL